MNPRIQPLAPTPDRDTNVPPRQRFRMSVPPILQGLPKAIARSLIPACRRDSIREFLLGNLPRRPLTSLDARLGIFFPHYYRKAGIIFIHVPKAAGTSVAHAIYGRSISHHTAAFFCKADPEAFQRYYSFSIVRNPFDRLVSSFFFAKGGGTPLVPVHRPARFQVPEFETFESFVRDWLPLNWACDYVFQPQARFLLDERRESVLVQELFEIRDLARCQSKLECILDRPMSLNSLNMVERADFRSFYTDDTFELVYDLYREDFDRLGHGERWLADVG